MGSRSPDRGQQKFTSGPKIIMLFPFFAKDGVVNIIVNQYILGKLRA